MEQFCPSTKEALLHLLIESHIGAPEPVDRLLRIADQKELAGDWAGSAPVCLAGIVRREQEEYFGLQGVGVLEFVDEKVAEALLQLAAHAGISAYEISRLDKKIEKIEPSRLGLQEFIVPNRRLQSGVQKGSEIGVACRNEGIEIGLGLAPEGQDLVPRKGPKSCPLGAFPGPTPPSCDTTKLRLESVVVAIANRLQPGRLFDEAGNLCQIAGKVILRPRARGRERSEPSQVIHQSVDGAAPVEGLAPPRLRKIAVLAKSLHRTTQLFARGLPA